MWQRLLRVSVAALFGALFAVALSAPFSAAQDRPAAAASASSASNASANVVEIPIDDEIEPILAGVVVRGIQQANDNHASLILITLNTPGGLDTSMREIIHAILTSHVPVVTYVTPTGARAASAGFFILESADVAAMSPGTETGAASPVFVVGGYPMQVDETMHRKVLNDATAYLRSYVSKRGRNVDVASTAVTDAKAFSDEEALSGNLIELVATSPSDLLAKLNGRTIARFDGSTTQLALAHPNITSVQWTARERFLSRIVQPDVFFVLLILGVLGLYTEFTHPGMFAPGVFGAICLLLALYAMHMLPVSMAGLLLIVCALVLFVLEAKFPTHGVLGVGGVIAMVLGALFLVQSPITGMGVSLWTALGVAIPFAVIVIVLMRLVMRSMTWKQATGKEELIGEEGDVTEPIDASHPAGMIFVHGELWRATALGGQSISRGARVRVRKVSGLTLEVEPVEVKPGGVRPIVTSS
ncbi:MAG: nodulation protein NfeD [Candidatus Acidiferrales bacterium]